MAPTILDLVGVLEHAAGELLMSSMVTCVATTSNIHCVLIDPDHGPMDLDGHSLVPFMDKIQAGPDDLTGVHVYEIHANDRAMA